MASNHRQTAVCTKLLLFALASLTSSIQMAECGCRMQERNTCETICQWNATRNSYDCTLRVIVILPKKDTVEASLSRVINATFCRANAFHTVGLHHLHNFAFSAFIELKRIIPFVIELRLSKTGFTNYEMSKFWLDQP